MANIPLINTIMQGVTGVGQMIQGAVQNRKSRQFAKDMYEMQKQDSLEMWNRQNEYNDPSMQMQRLKAAGLNPNLVYGNGTSTTASAQQMPNKPEWKPMPVEGLDTIGRSITSYQDVEYKDAIIDQTKQNTELLKLRELFEMFRGENEGLKVIGSRLDAELKQAIQKDQIAIIQESLRKLKIGNDFAVESNPIKIQQQILNTLHTKQATATSKAMSDQISANIALIEDKEKFQEIVNALAEKGIMPGDSSFDRMMVTLMNGTIPQSVLSSGTSGVINFLTKLILKK